MQRRVSYQLIAAAKNAGHKMMFERGFTWVSDMIFIPLPAPVDDDG